MIDVIQHINSVRREVGTRVLESGTGRTVTVSQTYNTTVADLWDACTNPERIPRWFLPISGDLRLGARSAARAGARRTSRLAPPRPMHKAPEIGRRRPTPLVRPKQRLRGDARPQNVGFLPDPLRQRSPPLRGYIASDKEKERDVSDKEPR